MTEGELKQKAKLFIISHKQNKFMFDISLVDLLTLFATKITKELEQELERKRIAIKTRKARIKDLEKQIEKLIDFVLSKTECCDVCPITDTCINREGTCPYAGILAKGEEEVTREWLLQFISKEIKEND